MFTCHETWKCNTITAGCDGIETEHMVNAHPILVSILAALFNAMLQRGYVPDDFGRGIVVPLIKNNKVMLQAVAIIVV